MDFSVIGCGRWGTFIAWYLHSLGYQGALYGRAGSLHLQRLVQTQTNGMVTFDEGVEFTSDLSEALAAELICISVASQALRSVMAQVRALRPVGKTFVLCMKGIEVESGLRLSQIVGGFVDEKETPVAVWVGPGHPQDFVKGIPNCMVIDSNNEAVKKYLVDSFSSELIRFYLGTDLIGTEIGAASKNVVGIAAGMLDGLNCSSLKGALMARGTHEISRLIQAMGGNPMSAYGLCHLGDYEATLFSEFSHNRRYGEMYVKGERFGKLAEGVSTTRAMILLGEQYSVDLPIVKAVDGVLSHHKDPQASLSSLFLRSIKKEFRK